MNYLLKNHLIILFVKFGMALVVLISCSDFAVFAQNNSVSQLEIIQLEEKAKRLGEIWEEQAIRQSLELFLKAAEEWENLNHPLNTAKCLREAVKLKLMLAEEKSALEFLRKSLILEKKTDNTAGESETLSLLTIVSIKLNDLKKSKFYHNQALKNAEKANQPVVSARAFFASSFFFLNEPNFPSMKGQLEKSLQIYREIGDKQGETEVLIELAYSHIINNDRVQGRDFAQMALEMARESNYHRSQTFALIALGDAYQRMGEWESAIKAFYEAESLFPENLDFYEKAILINRIGFYNLAYGDLNQAKKYFQNSLLIFKKIGRSVGSSELLSYLGQIAIEQENYLEAMNYFTQSRKIAEKSNDPLSLGMLDLKIGESYFYLGRFSESENYFLNSLNYYKKIGLNFRIAEAQEKLGLIYEKRKNYIEAKKKYLIALELNQKVHSKFAQAQTLFNLARLEMLQNETESGLKIIEESILLTESSNSQTANSNLKRAYFSNVYDRYELYINLLMKMHKQTPNENYAIQALQATEKSRARSMLENLSLAEANFTKDADVATVKREKEIRVLLNAKADKLTDLLSRNANNLEVERIDGEIRELEHDLEEIKANLKQSSPIYSAIKNPAPFDVVEFQNKILDENSLLLEFSFGADESYLWLVGKTEVNSYVLPPREQIETHIQTLRELLHQRGIKPDETVEDYQARITEDENIYRLEARGLSDKLFGQIADKISNKRLIIVPDGKLNYFPAAALPLPNSDTNEPILLTNETIYEPSAQTLSLLSKIGSSSVQATKNLLVFFDPIFSKDDSRISSENKADENFDLDSAAFNEFRSVEALNSLLRLTASKSEADSIIEIVGESKSDSFSGFSANRDQLLNARIADYKIIHFATHGLINEQRPELSGIVLSRFDEKGQELNQFVRLHDIYGLNLNADLVVLSACETGVGKEIKGEGLMSLNNAFLQIGAKSVVSSLWKIEDGAAQELMKNFYRELSSGKISASQALRGAQIKMWRSPQYKSPFYWAAFTISGDFQNSPKLAAGYGRQIYLLLILPFSILLGIFLYRRKLRLSHRKTVNVS